MKYFAVPLCETGGMVLRQESGNLYDEKVYSENSVPNTLLIEALPYIWVQDHFEKEEEGVELREDVGKFLWYNCDEWVIDDVS